jgi:hypothetical protein
MREGSSVSIVEGRWKGLAIAKVKMGRVSEKNKERKQRRKTGHPGVQCSRKLTKTEVSTMRRFVLSAAMVLMAICGLAAQTPR